MCKDYVHNSQTDIDVHSRFSKNERLHLKKDIDDLFDKGEWFSFKSFVIVFKPSVRNDVQILISIPKKKQKFAHQRNKSKRIVREIYRNNKSEFYKQLNKMNLGVHFALISKSSDSLEFNKVKTEIISILKEITNRLSQLKE